MHSELNKNRIPTSLDKKRGFTLLEVLITMSIAIILATMAVPTFNGVLQRSRLTANVNLVVGALNLARSEAVKLGQSVRFQEIGVNDGWQLVIATGVDAGNVLKTFAPSDKELTVTLSTITYRSTGFRDFASNAEATMTVCDANGNGTDITVSTGGSVSSAESASC